MEAAVLTTLMEATSASVPQAMPALTVRRRLTIALPVHVQMVRRKMVKMTKTWSFVDLENISLE